MAMSVDDRSKQCRQWALAMTEVPSVTGSPDEAAFGPWLAEWLRGLAAFGAPDIWSFPVADGDARHCVAMLVRKAGRRTVVLTGHYDTVTVSDYGELSDLAIHPIALLDALKERLARSGGQGADLRARKDFERGDYLPGRGLLDMKAGLAAGLAAISDIYANESITDGNLLFLAVPDEENASAGARGAAARLAALAKQHDLDIAAVINLDAIADDGDGSAGRVVALGSVGKVLPTAYVVGLPVHSGYPLRGISAAVLASAIVQRLEWVPELTDESVDMPGTPVSLLSLRDGKKGYDVTTPATVFATWNVLSHRRDPGEVLDTIEALAREAVTDCISTLKDRAERSRQVAGRIAEAPDVPILRYGALLQEVRISQPEIDHELQTHARRLSSKGLTLPEQCHVLTAELWARSARTGPAVILGLGSTPYLASELDDEVVREAVDSLVADAPRLHGTEIRTVGYFAGISDVSFFGQVRTGSLEAVARDTPAWDMLVGLSPEDFPQMPTINFGPWGRDYHTPLERIETNYGFRILPGLLADLSGRILFRGS